MKRFEAEFGKWVVRFRWPLVALNLAVILLASSGMRFLTLENDTRIFFSERNPQLKALEALENIYSRSDNVLFALAPKDGNVFTRKTLSAVQWLTEAGWQTPFSSKVHSLTNFQNTYADGDDLVVEDLVRGADTLSDADIERIKKTALAEPALVNFFVSPSGHVTGVNVTIISGNSADSSPKVTAFARKLVKKFRDKYPDIDIYLAGSVVFDNAFTEVSISDLSTLVPTMYFVLLVIIGVTLRSFAGSALTLGVILVSMTTGMGLAGWLGMSMNPASTNAPTIILTLAVADSVHLLASMFHSMSRGMDKRSAVAESIRLNLQPVFLTSATTAIGFLGMNFSDAPPFRDLGNIVAMGVMAAFVYSVLFLPALASVLPIRVTSKTNGSFHNWCGWLAEFVIARRKVLLWSLSALIPLVSVGILNIELNDNFSHYFDERYEVRRASDFAQKNLTGFDIIEYSLNSDGPGGINDPGYLSTVDKFAQWYGDQPGVTYVSVISDTVKRLNKAMHGDDRSYYRIPEKRELSAQYLLLYEMSLPFGLDLNDIINVDKSATRMRIMLANVTSRSIRDLDEKARQWLKTNAPKTMFTYGSGLSIIWAHISKRNIDTMLIGSFLALFMISGLLVFALRSFRLGLISMVPNLGPAFVAFGIWGMTQGTVGLAASIIVAMTLGIVVDDTIHFLSKYIRARRENSMTPEDAVRYSFSTVGPAIWVTSVALVAGFGILAFSGFKLNHDMGLMSAITIAIALAMDFLLLPPLLIKMEGK